MRVNIGNWTRREDFDAQFSPGRCKRLRDRAHSPEHVAAKSLRLAIAAAQQMKEKAHRRASIVRPAVLAVDIIREKQRFDFLGLVVPIEKIAQAASKERNKLSDFLCRHPAKPISDAQQLPPAFRPAKRGIRRRLQKKWLQITREFFQLVVYPDKRLRIAQ